jgi:regulatory protein
MEKTRKSKDSDPMAAALRLLGRRDRSTAELTRDLHNRGYDEERTAAVIERCRELGYLNDRRFAEERARAMLRDGRGVGRRIELDLLRRGIGPENAHDAIDKAQHEHPPEEVARALLARRFPGFEYSQADNREKRRVMAFFQRRGFSLDLILAILRETDEKSP